MTQDHPACPVSGWDTGIFPQQQAVMVRLHYLSQPLQDLSDAHRSPVFLLTETQTQELIDTLQATLLKLKSAGFQRPPLQG